MLTSLHQGFHLAVLNIFIYIFRARYGCKNIYVFRSLLKSRHRPEMACVEVGLFSQTD